jgi:lysyl-tRNA synthetase class 2
MLEFYQAYSDFRDLMDLTQEMLTGVAEKVTGSRQVPYLEHVLDFGVWHRYPLKEAVLHFWPGGRRKPSEEDLRSEKRLRALLEELGVPFEKSDGRGKLLGSLFEGVVEPKLIQPTFIYDYPTEISPLAKAKPDDPETVERFELYIGGMEIANAYSELNDPVEQRTRFRRQLEARERGDQEAHAMDLDYIRALCYGMPPTAGEGIGIDRLTMILTNSRSIREVILFPVLRPEPFEDLDIVNEAMRLL